MGNWEGLKDFGIIIGASLAGIALVALWSFLMGLLIQRFGIDVIPVVCLPLLFGMMLWGFAGDDIRAWWERRKGKQ